MGCGNGMLGLPVRSAFCSGCRRCRSFYLFWQDIGGTVEGVSQARAFLVKVLCGVVQRFVYVMWCCESLQFVQSGTQTRCGRGRPSGSSVWLLRQWLISSVWLLC